MKTLQRTTSTAITALAALSLVACSAESDDASSGATGDTQESTTETTGGDDAGDITIGLVRQLSSGDYFESWLAGAQAEAERLGVTLDIYNANGDDAQQALDLEQALNAGVDVIAIDHGYTETVQQGAQAAIDAGIPVVAFDVDTEVEGVVDISQSDAVLADAILGKLIDDTGGTAEVLYVYVAGYAPLDRRNEVWEEVKAENPGLEQVAQIGSVSDNTAAEVADQAKAALQANSGITTVFAPYDEFAKGAVLAIEELGLSDTVTVYGADISTADIEVLTAPDSPWVATATTDPSNVGAVTIRAAYLAATGGDLPAGGVEIPPALITAEDLVARGVTDITQLVAEFPELQTPDLIPAS